MASKRTVKRRESDQSPELKRLRKLSRRARAEVASLLQRNRAGTITSVELNTGLKEVKRQLKQMSVHFYKIC
jgi:hypothetical protein